MLCLFCCGRIVIFVLFLQSRIIQNPKSIISWSKYFIFYSMKAFMETRKQQYVSWFLWSPSNIFMSTMNSMTTCNVKQQSTLFFASLVLACTDCTPESSTNQQTKSAHSHWRAAFLTSLWGPKALTVAFSKLSQRWREKKRPFLVIYVGQIDRNK